MVLVSNAPALESAGVPQRILRSTSGNGYPGSSDDYVITKPEASRRRTKQDAFRGSGLPVEVRECGALTELERRSPKYLAYRARARKDLGKDGKQVWSDELEDAFQFAIRQIPSWMGKQKAQLMQQSGNEKLSGKNEFISWWISKLTGQRRNRKQISSHIQVLKKKIEQNDWAECVTPNDGHNNESNTSRGLYFDHEQGKMIVTESKPAKLEDQSSDGVYSPEGTPALNTLQYLPSIQCIQFKMCVHPPNSNFKPDSRMSHIYTTMQSEVGAPPTTLEDISNWQHRYPKLMKLYESELDNREVIHIETGFALLGAQPARRSRLGIHLFTDVRCERSYIDWESRTTFYENGRQAYGRHNQLNYQRIKHSRKTRVELSLESSWWVKVFSLITERRQELQATWAAKVQEGRHHKFCRCDICTNLERAADEAVQTEEEQARRYIREMSVMQEIFAVDSNSDHKTPELIAVLLWGFYQTRGGEAAMTTWRRVTQSAHLGISTASTAIPLGSSTFNSLCESNACYRELLSGSPNSYFSVDVPTAEAKELYIASQNSIANGYTLWPEYWQQTSQDQHLSSTEIEGFGDGSNLNSNSSTSSVPSSSTSETFDAMSFPPPSSTHPNNQSHRSTITPTVFSSHRLIDRNDEHSFLPRSLDQASNNFSTRVGNEAYASFGSMDYASPSATNHFSQQSSLEHNLEDFTGGAINLQYIPECSDVNDSHAPTTNMQLCQDHAGYQPEEASPYYFDNQISHSHQHQTMLQATYQPSSLYSNLVVNEQPECKPFNGTATEEHTPVVYSDFSAWHAANVTDAFPPELLADIGAKYEGVGFEMEGVASQESGDIGRGGGQLTMERQAKSYHGGIIEGTYEMTT